MKQIEIRGMFFSLDFLLKVDKKHFISLFADKKEKVQEAAWQECLKVSKRKEEEPKPKKSRRRKKSEE